LLQSFRSFLIDLEDVFKDPHVSFFDFIKSIHSDCKQSKHLSKSHHSLYEFNYNHSKSSKKGQKAQFDSYYQVSVLLDNRWLKCTLIQEELDDGRISNQISWDHTNEHNTSSCLVSPDFFEIIWHITKTILQIKIIYIDVCGHAIRNGSISIQFPLI